MEIIGLFFEIVVAMTLAIVAGIACAGFVLLTIRRQAAGRIRTAILAGLLPAVTAIYLFATAVFVSLLPPSLAGEDLLFGDGSEPLPNGYAIHYLGKMPSAAWIEQNPPGKYGVGSVAALEVLGSRVAGKYDQTFSSEQPTANYFLFDTATGKSIDFQTEAELTQAVNEPIHLTETQFFHGQEPTSHKPLSWLWLTLAVGPPGLSTLWLARQWFRLRNSG